MNYLPQLASNQKSVLNTTTFAGYNHNEIIADGEMYNTENLSGRMYPAKVVVFSTDFCPDASCGR